MTVSTIIISCGKGGDDPDPNPPPPVLPFGLVSSSINNTSSQPTNYNVSRNPTIRLRFPVPINRSTTAASIQLRTETATVVPINIGYENGDSVVTVVPTALLSGLTKYTVAVSTQLKSVAGASLISAVNVNLITAID